MNTILAGDHFKSDTHNSRVPGTNFGGNQNVDDSQYSHVSPAALPNDAIKVPQPINKPRRLDPYLYDPALGLLAQQLDDLEQLRKAQDNRIRIMTRTEPDKDGGLRGFGLDETNPAVQTMTALADGTKKLEHETVLALQRLMRKHPLNTWRASQLGIGEKTLARLLAAIGDPYVRMDTNEPRTVSQLWAYCGLHCFPSSSVDTSTQCRIDEGLYLLAPGSTVAAKRMKGVQANWSTIAKTRTYLLAQSTIKAGVRTRDDGTKYAKDDSEYARLYLERREHTKVTHPEWTPLHSNNDALRIVSKRILRNLWRAARLLHEHDSSVDSGVTELAR